MLDDFFAMPESVHYHNGTNQRCDALSGPCACGAWHKLDEWRMRMIEGRPVFDHEAAQREILRGANAGR
jgi:hypothetical protein